MRHFLLICVFVLTACTFVSEPIVVTRMPTATAVPPTAASLSVPTKTSVPTITPVHITLPPPTSTVSASPTWTPAAVPTTMLKTTLSDFLIRLQSRFNAGDFEGLRRLMSEQLVLGIYPISRQKMSANQAIERFSDQFVISTNSSSIQINEVNIIPELIETFAPETLAVGNQEIVAAVLSSGWGLSGEDQAILYIAVEDGSYVMAGFLIIGKNDPALSELDVIMPPPGLIYQLDENLWHINETGEHEQLLNYGDSLALNPSGSLALALGVDSNQLIVFDLNRNTRETIEVEGTLAHPVWNIPWLDEKTVVLMVGAPDENTHQFLFTGNLSLLDVLNGQLTVFSPELSFYTHLSITSDGRILYEGEDGPILWEDDIEQNIAFSHTFTLNGMENEIEYLDGPVMSPDGRYIVVVGRGEYGLYNLAYILSDLTTSTNYFIDTFPSPGTDALLTWGIHWSPDSQWLALDPPSTTPLGREVLIVHLANLSDNLHLGAGTSKPLWLDSERLVFKTSYYGYWHYLDLQTGEQFWLDLPAGAEVVHYASSN